MNKPNINSPLAYPLLGHIPNFLPDKLNFLLTCSQKYGEVVRLQVGRTTYLLSNPDDIKHVLVDNHQNYDKTVRLTSRRGKDLSGEGLLTSAGQTHLRQRRMLQPAFSHKYIASFADIMVSSTEQLLSQWKDSTVLNIADEMMNHAQHIVLKTLFSEDYHAHNSELARAIAIRRRYMQYIFGSLLPFPEYLPTPINREYQKSIKQIDDFIYGLIRERRNAVALPQDLLSMLMQSQYEDGSFMSDKQVRDEALTLCITGYETIGEALTWTGYLLSQHPEVELKLWAELDEVLGNRSPNLEDLRKLRYTEMVLSESMRLYPPTWIYIRMARQEDVLPSGATIPAGSKIYLCQYVVHRQPSYFPEPEKFDPERFSEAVCRTRPQLAYFPFGGGPRLCIGKAFAMMEGVLVLACIAQRFQLKLVPGQIIEPEPKITLSPKYGLKMELIQR